MAVDRPIDAEPQHLKTLLGLLAQYLPGVTVWAFGSRVKWTSRPDSDLDLVVFTKEDQHPKVYQLKEVLEESNLPFRVDVLIWDVISEAFRDNIRREYVVLVGGVDYEWPLEELEAIADEVTVGYVGPMASEYVESGIPFLRSLNIEKFRVNQNDIKFITPEFHHRIKKSALKPGDVAIVRTGKPGTCAVIPDWLTDANCSDLVVVRCGKRIRPRFLCYWVNSVAAHHIDSHTVGAVQQHFNVGAAKKMKVAVPSLSVQDEVIAVLGALDDRITLLRETNATLEAIAQALFKSWFVDFDPVRAKQEGRAPEGMSDATAALFPDCFEESELGLVPKGWRAGSFQECSLRVESGGTPKRTVSEYWNGGVSWLTSGEVRSPIVFSTKETITELGVKESSAKVWPVGTTVIAMYGATAGEVCLLANPTTANQACCGLIPLSNMRTFLFLNARRERANLASKSSGSAQQNLNKGLVANHPIIIPSDEVLASYESISGALLNGWIENEQQAQTLAALRDTLLPRLISGQLRLPEAEALIEEATA